MELRVFCVFTVVVIGPCLAFNINISPHQPLGQVVFNASVGANWINSFNPFLSDKHGLKLFSLGHDSGHLTLTSKPSCADLIYNPFYLFIEAKKSDLQQVVTPLRVHVLHLKCTFKFKRKLQPKPMQRISVPVGVQEDSCYDRDVQVADLQQYLPASLRKCQYLFSLRRPLDFRLEQERIFTRRIVCMTRPFHLFTGRIHSTCGSMLLQLAVYSQPRPALVYQPAAMLEQSVARGRFRRAADTTPSFPLRTYERRVLENQEAGFLVDTFTADDPDPGAAGKLRYSLLATRDGRSQNMFQIDSATGRVTTSVMLDRESMSVHHFSLLVQDGGRPARSAQALLKIFVDDENDHTPTFEYNTYEEHVLESLTVGSTVLTVRARDADVYENADVTYTLINRGGPNEAFRVDPRTGAVTTRLRLDRERVAEYRFKVMASDGAEAKVRRSSTAEVHITVLDENDNKPVFIQESHIVEVAEDIDPSRRPVIAEIKATDKDEGQNALIRYSITGGNHADVFSINAQSGQLSLLKGLDYETVRVYRLTVRAQDGGDPPKSNTTRVIIAVIDRNDNKPRFFSSLFRESVSENVQVGYSILRVQALDDDGGVFGLEGLRYSLIHTPKPCPLAIHPVTGWLTTNNSLDREHTKQFNFQVQARDQGKPPKSSSASVIIDVRDVNDNAPVFNPRSYEVEISEESLPGSAVLQVTATDADAPENARVSFRLSAGNVRGAFSIMSQSGVGYISVARTLNYKEQNKYVLTVTASDTVNEHTATVTINITDANTYRPAFQGAPYQQTLPEDTKIGATVIVVLATDGDSGVNSRITYSMADNRHFRLNKDTGEITVQEELDREDTAGYTLSVTATDHGKPPKSDTVDVEIVIRDVNDNSPKFAAPSYAGKVDEDVQSGRSVLTISADDLDIGLNGRVRYTFDGGNNGGGDFMLDPVSGVLRTNRELDRERTAKYKLKAFAVDRGQPERSTEVTITVDVLDVNDNAPQWPKPQLDLYVYENSPIGTTVDSVTAVDPDEGLNSKVEYKIVGGIDAKRFQLVHDRQGAPARFTTLEELDYEGKQNEYRFMVRARSGHLFSDAIVIVHVKDVNDNQPQLEDFTIVFNNFKDHFPVGPIGRVPATDPDVSDTLRYEFVTGNDAGALHLNRETGHLRLDARLNSDVPTNGTLHIAVTDGINSVRATCTLVVRLVTEDMLFNSITVRLRGLDAPAFLSPLYHLFVQALASVVPTSEDNVYIINVQDDTDVLPEKVLNVSLSVRSRVERQRDVFLAQQDLRERVYLRRAQLTRVSTLEVLPFDDTLCVREPCLNYEHCVSILKFGNASAFATSDSMLFRPIRPINSFACRCPPGFTGMEAEYLCDTEVNLCYSSPCGGNGTCLPHEGGYTCICAPGYTGPNCATDMVDRRYRSCPFNLCKNGGRCIPLIKGGFRCEICSETNQCTNCAELPYHNAFCELTTRSFPRGSFVMFPPLKRRHRFTIELQFATKRTEGLLFYNGRYNEKHDFIALELVNGQVQFSFSLGSNPTRVTASVLGGVSNGQWTKVRLNYVNRTVTLSVGEHCPVEAVVRYGKQLANHTCAVRKAHLLPEKCADVTETCHRFLDLTGPLQFGGLPTLPTTFQVQNKNFVGCIRDVTIDGNLLDFNNFSYNNGSLHGCTAIRKHCQPESCQKRGKCLEGWDGFTCDCRDPFGGRDCSQRVVPSRSLALLSTMQWSKTFPPVKLPFYHGLSFRTKAPNCRLMKILMDKEIQIAAEYNTQIHLELVDGIITCLHPLLTLNLTGARLDDGEWHNVQAQWQKGRLVLSVDHGQLEVSRSVGDWMNNRVISSVQIGGSQTRFIGCIKDVRVGNSPGSTLGEPTNQKDIKMGCVETGRCNSKSCPKKSKCVDGFKTHHCICEKGYAGPNCDDVCIRWNPCKEGSACVRDMTSSTGYRCVCPPGRIGSTCSDSLTKTCPSTWWGHPICGPCNCPKGRGFDSSCNKTSGECGCKEAHYRPVDSDTCFSCDCYSVGSFERVCHPVTGQCPCRKGVIGRRCDACASRSAEVTWRGCEVLYDACPRSRIRELWWPRTTYDRTAVIPCPSGSIGNATLHCTSVGWEEPNLFHCLSTQFSDLRSQTQRIEKGGLKLNSYVVKSLVTNLARAIEVDELQGSDVNVTLNLVGQVLDYELGQTGLNLTHAQDRTFLQNLIHSVSRVLDPDLTEAWKHIHLAKENGAADLLDEMEDYSETLARNMPLLFTQPFDIVHENVIFGVDYIPRSNKTSVHLPKYNNKVQNEYMFDKDTNVELPAGLLKMDGGVVTASYILYRNLSGILPLGDDSGLFSSTGLHQVLNAPVFTLNILDGNRSLHGAVSKPVVLTFKLLQTHNRTTPQCVRRSLDGWTSSDCSLRMRSKTHVTCACTHLSTYSVLMDASTVERNLEPNSVTAIVTYVGVAFSLACLLICFLTFVCLRGLYSNANSIHINLVLCIFLSQLIFVAGVDRVVSVIGCRIVAVGLHYFFMASFAWMFVESLHLYRMMTEIRDINHGAMKFYYVIGYFIPGIIVSLAIGLQMDSYGNGRFCWLSRHDVLIWSLVGPVCFVILINFVLFVMSIFTVCTHKKEEREFKGLKHGLCSALVLFPLQVLAWVFALLAVNDDVDAFYYLFAIFVFLQGLFVLLSHVVFNRQTQQEVVFALYRAQGKKGFDDSETTNTRSLNRSALAYHHNDSSLEGGLNRMNIGVSTTSTTSRSTSKSSGLCVRDAQFHSGHGTSTSNNPGNGHIPTAGIPPYGYGMFPDVTQQKPTRNHRRQSESDSELSAVENDLDLASSHSSDDDVSESWGHNLRRHSARRKKACEAEKLRVSSPTLPKPNAPVVSFAPIAQKDNAQPSPREVAELNNISRDYKPSPRDYVSRDYSPRVYSPPPPAHLQHERLRSPRQRTQSPVYRINGGLDSLPRNGDSPRDCPPAYNDLRQSPNWPKQALSPVNNLDAEDDIRKVHLVVEPENDYNRYKKHNGDFPVDSPLKIDSFIPPRKPGVDNSPPLKSTPPLSDSPSIRSSNSPPINGDHTPTNHSPPVSYGQLSASHSTEPLVQDSPPRLPPEVPPHRASRDKLAPLKLRDPRNTVQILSHNGSISGESDAASHETSV